MERKRERTEGKPEISEVSQQQRQINLKNAKCVAGPLFVHITLLTGDDLFMKLVAAVVELICLPVSQKHFTAAHLHTTTTVTRVILAG